MSIAEGPIRAYLTFLRDPGLLIDRELVLKLTGELEQATDPIERLRLRAELERASRVDEDTLRREFIAEAKAWADDQGIGVDAFLTEGVPAAVLAEAGFPVKVKGAGRRRTAKRVTADDVMAAIPPRKRFRAADLAAVSGASAATVRKVLAQAVADGVVIEEGPDPDHQGVGRAPMVYRRKPAGK